MKIIIEEENKNIPSEEIFKKNGFKAQPTSLALYNNLENNQTFIEKIIQDKFLIPNRIYAKEGQILCFHAWNGVEKIDGDWNWKGKNGVIALDLTKFN